MIQTTLDPFASASPTGCSNTGPATLLMMRASGAVWTSCMKMLACRGGSMFSGPTVRICTGKSNCLAAISAPDRISEFHSPATSACTIDTRNGLASAMAGIDASAPATARDMLPICRIENPLRRACEVGRMFRDRMFEAPGNYRCDCTRSTARRLRLTARSSAIAVTITQPVTKRA